MRELRASTEASVAARPAECLALLTDVGAYPDWCPDTVVRAEAVEDGRVRVTLRLGRGPVAGRFEELMTVRVDPAAREVRLERVPHDAGDPERLEVTWRIGDGPPTPLELRLAAVLELPRLVPLGGMAESVAQGLVAAASRALSPPSPMASASSS